MAQTRDLKALEQAYDDRLGIEAAFNLTILERLNRELDADSNLQADHLPLRVRARQAPHLLAPSQVPH